MDKLFTPGDKFIGITNHVKKTGSSDIEAFELLYDKHSPKLLGYIMQDINSKIEAEKILVTVFLRMWDIMKNLDNVDEEKLLKLLIFSARRYLNKS